MKNYFRFLTFLPLLLIMLLGTALSSNSQATAANNQIDQACMLSCQQQQTACFIAAGGKNSAENICLAHYRHCIARCDKS